MGGARHIGEPHDHKSGGLEPLGPIGVYAYGPDETKSAHIVGDELNSTTRARVVEFSYYGTIK